MLPILGATRTQAQNQLAEQLQAALASRGSIERAKGIIMQAEGVDAQTAFERLRTVSMNGNHKLRDVAERTIANHESHCPLRTLETMSDPRLAVAATGSGSDGNPTGAALAGAAEGHVGDAAVAEVMQTSKTGSR